MQETDGLNHQLSALGSFPSENSTSRSQTSGFSVRSKTT